jgi:antitoxin component of MazEF toxin-antitoxin module
LAQKRAELEDPDDQQVDMRAGYAKDISIMSGFAMTRVTVGRWGKNLALRFPNEIAAAFQLREGDQVEIDPGPEQIVIRHAKPRYTLDELFAGKSPDEWRAIYANAYDWGPDVGQENIEELARTSGVPMPAT